HSSLSTLHRLAVSGLKIDRSFVRQMEQPSSRLITKAILALSENLGLQVMAEGIETVRQANELERLNCEYGQGYYFSKPVPASAARKYILAESPGMAEQACQVQTSNLSGCPHVTLV